MNYSTLDIPTTHTTSNSKIKRRQNRTNVFHQAYIPVCKNLTIASLNVCGLRSKLNLNILQSYLENSDIICLSETKVSDLDINIQGFHYLSAKKRIASHKCFGIHGIGVCIKDQYSKFVSVINDAKHDNFCSNNVLWLLVEKEMLGFKFIIGAIYMPHEQSVYYEKDQFDSLAADIAYLNANYDAPICLAGDFNARTGTLDDYITLEAGVNDLDLSLIDCNPMDPLSSCHPVAFNNSRTNRDPRTNNNGCQLIELCKNFDIRILNGRIGSDCGVGDYTCTSTSGNSTIDYIIISQCLLSSVTDFGIDIFDSCTSDKHKGIYLKLSANCNNVNSVLQTNPHTDTNKHVPGSDSPLIISKWCQNSAQSYQEHFDIEGIDNIKMKIEALTSDNSKAVSHKHINEICDDITNMLISPATCIGISKEIINKENFDRKKHTNKKHKSEPWFNKECMLKRTHYIKLKNKLYKDKSDSAQSKLKTEALNYKKLIKKTKKEFYCNLTSQLRNTKSADPKVYWNIINSVKPKYEHPCGLDIDKLYNHFSILGRDMNSAESEEDNFDPRKITHSINDYINNPFTYDEIYKASRKLKNNKSCGSDFIINEFIKNCPDSALILITSLFNIILDSGILPKSWTLGHIIPIYKKKGSPDDPSNYRGITLLSCLGKLFTSVLNDRLTSYLDSTGTICENQAGFRENYSILDHVFSLHCIIDIYLKQKKKLFCAFVDYSKAFDMVRRSALWSKLISCGINGKIITVIYNLYSEAKSCVKYNNSFSPYFECNVGVRQGDNLSPLLFSIFLNDLETHMRNNNVKGLDYINSLTIKHLSTDDIEMWLRLYVLLYADDTIILSESATDLQNALNAMHDYCQTWQLTVNASKTKIVIFSRGKTRKKPLFKLGNDTIEVCDHYTYLGIVFNFNGKFKKAISKQVSQARHAMFALLSKAAKLMLPFDITCDLFDKLVLPILLYGCEVWGIENIDYIEIFYKQFLRRLLKVNKFTANCMLYGEVGKYKLHNTVAKRMINFWSRLVTGKQTKFSFRLYSLIKSMDESLNTNYSSEWTNKIRYTLNHCGFSNIWLAQENHSHTWLKCSIDRRLLDIDIQNWSNDVNTNSTCYNYRIFKTTLNFERYLLQLSYKDRLILTRFRCGNTKLPSNKKKFLQDHVDDENNMCNLCQKGVLGDEFHYLFTCKYFNSFRQQLIPSYYYKRPNTRKMFELYNSNKSRVLINLCKFIQVIRENFP